MCMCVFLRGCVIGCVNVPLQCSGVLHENDMTVLTETVSVSVYACVSVRLCICVRDSYY